VAVGCGRPALASPHRVEGRPGLLSGMGMDRTQQGPAGGGADEEEEEEAAHSASSGSETSSTAGPGRGRRVATMQLCPLELRFSQRKMRNVFADGRLIDESVDVVQAVRRPPDEAELYGAAWKLEAPFPPIDVLSWRCKLRDETTGRPLIDEDGRERFEDEESWFTLDNRRLYCLQRAALKLLPERCTAGVVAELRKERRQREIRKFRTLDGGESILIGSRVDCVPFSRWAWREEVAAIASGRGGGRGAGGKGGGKGSGKGGKGGGKASGKGGGYSAKGSGANGYSTNGYGTTGYGTSDYGANSCGGYAGKGVGKDVGKGGGKGGGKVGEGFGKGCDGKGGSKGRSDGQVAGKGGSGRGEKGSSHGEGHAAKGEGMGKEGGKRGKGNGKGGGMDGAGKNGKGGGSGGKGKGGRGGAQGDGCDAKTPLPAGLV